MPPFVGSTDSSSTAILLAHYRAFRARQASVMMTGVSTTGFVGDVGVSIPAGQVNVVAPQATLIAQPPEVMIGVSLVDVGERTDEGHIITAVTPAWMSVLRELESDSNALSRLDSRQMEELVAGAYREEGWEVTLTPRSGDGGRDVIARRDDFGAIKLLDQVKAYKPGHLVEAEEVRAMYGVLNLDQKASKAVITTTSRFAPHVAQDFANVTPTRLDLRDGADLRRWLATIFARFGR